MNRSYETVFIVDAAIPGKEINIIFNNVKKFITDREGRIVEAVDVGVMKLAYEIKKKSSGVYNFIEFELAPEFIKDLETFYRRDDRILRSLVCRLDKYGVEYNVARRKRQEKIFNNQKILSLI
ncbi:MAG: 30S ribosomal protein S6 [Cytophagales bacterium]|nr:30S ribosomal protein S6 [Cytophagales bacterium]